MRYGGRNKQWNGTCVTRYGFYCTLTYSIFRLRLINSKGNKQGVARGMVIDGTGIQRGGWEKKGDVAVHTDQLLDQAAIIVVRH